MTYVCKVYLEIDEVLLLKSVMLLLHFQVILPRGERGNESERGGKQTFCFVRLQLSLSKSKTRGTCLNLFSPRSGNAALRSK